MLLLLLSHFSGVQLRATLWTAAHQAPLPTGFSRQEHWSGLPFPSPMHARMLRRLSHVRLCATPWTAAHQAPPFLGLSRQEYWSGVPLPSPMTNLDSILKSRDITLHTKIHIIKALVFPVVMYGCEIQTIKKAEC